MEGVDTAGLNAALEKEFSGGGEQLLSEPTEKEQSQEAQSSSADQALAQHLIDLDKAEKFRYQGKEWTKDELQKAVMRTQDYTKKTQELADERRKEFEFRQALMVDLEKVKQNPALADEFRIIYPKHYHDALKWVSGAQNTQNSEQAKPEANNNIQLPESLMKRLEQLDTVEGYFRDQQVKASEAELASILDSLNEKHPTYSKVLEKIAVSEAQAALMANPSTKIERGFFEDVYKTYNEILTEANKRSASELITKQKEANKKGADVPQGGGVPGGAPKVPKTLKEAKRFALEDIASGAV